MSNSTATRLANERRVYLYMFDHANADGFLSTSAVVIAQTLGIGSEATFKHIQSLERQGEVYRLGSDTPSLSRYAVTKLAASDDDDVLS